MLLHTITHSIFTTSVVLTNWIMVCSTWLIANWLASPTNLKGNQEVYNVTCEIRQIMTREYRDSTASRSIINGGNGAYPGKSNKPTKPYNKALKRENMLPASLRQ
jgi:hypothetical protein